MKDMNIFLFDNYVGDFDEFNPRYVMQEPFVKEIITLISMKEPYFFSIKEIQKKLGIKDREIETALKLLSNISAITINDNKLKLNFPFFTKKDVKKIKKIMISELKNNIDFFDYKFGELKLLIKDIYPDVEPNLSLYHLVCGRVFDGSIFEYLENQGLLSQSFKQKDGRDYMMIGYQNKRKCNKFNAKLFCSFNHARYEKSSLSSFGNAKDPRFDYFRYFQLRNTNSLTKQFVNMHRCFSGLSKDEVLKNTLLCIDEIMQNKEIRENKYLEILKETGYVDENNKFKVPVFNSYESAMEKITNKVITSLGETLKERFLFVKEAVFKKNISAIKHQVDESQISNELWHIYFGLLNLLLIKKKVVARPEKFKGGKKYLKCIYLEK